MADDDAAADDKAAGKGAALTLSLDVEKDTLTAQNDIIGLAQSYVARTLHAAADDIADIVVAATNQRRVDLLVVAAADFRSDADRAVAIRLQVDALTRRLDASVPEAAPRGGHEAEGEAVMGLGVAAAAALQLLPSVAGTLTKVLARQFTTAGAQLDAVKGAVDLRVAGAIRAKLGSGSAMTVRIERLWTPDRSPLLAAVAALLDRYADVQVALGVAAEAQAITKVALDTKVSARTSAQAQLVELAKGVAADTAHVEGSPWRTAWDFASGRADEDLTSYVQAQDRAASRVAELRALQGAVETLLVGVLAADESGDIPLAAALRGEWLAGDSSGERLLLYVNALHGGVDHVLETKLGADKRAVLAGSGVEFALVGPAGVVAASGVRDNLWGGVMRLDKIGEFRGGRVDSAFEPNQRRAEP